MTSGTARVPGSADYVTAASYFPPACQVRTSFIPYSSVSAPQRSSVSPQRPNFAHKLRFLHKTSPPAPQPHPNAPLPLLLLFFELYSTFSYAQITTDSFFTPVFTQTAIPTAKVNIGIEWTGTNEVNFVQLEFGGTTAASLSDANVTVLSASGCEASHFSGFESGHVVALTLAAPYDLSGPWDQNNDCSAYQRALNAQTAGASAVIFVAQTVTNASNADWPRASSQTRLLVLADNNPMINKMDLNWQFATSESSPLVGVSTNIPVFLFDELFGQLIAEQQLSAFTATLTSSATVKQVRTQNTFCTIAGMGSFPGKNGPIIVGAQWDSSASSVPDYNDLAAAAIVSNVALTSDYVRQWLGSRMVNPATYALWGGHKMARLGAIRYIQNNKDFVENKLVGYIDVNTPGSMNGLCLVPYYNVGQNDSLIVAQSDHQLRFSGYLADLMVGNRGGVDSATFGVPFEKDSALYAFFLSGAPATGITSGSVGIRDTVQSYQSGAPFTPYNPCYRQACGKNLNWKIIKNARSFIGNVVQYYGYEDYAGFWTRYYTFPYRGTPSGADSYY